MRRDVSGLMLVCLCLGFLVPTEDARAGLGRDLAYGLTFFDFRFSGSRDLLSDGITINGVANYNNREFDFGNGDLTLTGPVRFTGSFSRRGIPELEVSLNTANQPLRYAFNINTGAQDLTATGSVLIDMETTVNKYGFYDQIVQVSNRGTFETDGYVLRDGRTLDFDIGPIDIHGNVYFDALALLIEPLFAVADVENVFAKLSGRAQKASEYGLQRDQLMARFEAGEQLSDLEIEQLVNSAIVAAMLGGGSPDGVFDELFAQHAIVRVDDPASGAAGLSSVEAVPEPGTFLLMAGTAAGIMLRRRRRRQVSL